MLHNGLNRRCPPLVVASGDPHDRSCASGGPVAEASSLGEAVMFPS